MSKGKLLDIYNEMIVEIAEMTEDQIKELDLSKEEIDSLIEAEKEDPENIYLPYATYLIGLYRGLKAGSIK